MNQSLQDLVTSEKFCEKQAGKNVTRGASCQSEKRSVSKPTITAFTRQKERTGVLLEWHTLMFRQVLHTALAVQGLKALGCSEPVLPWLQELRGAPYLVPL